jgi:hypothetical protein
MDSFKPCERTVKLGDKKRFDKEQIGALQTPSLYRLQGSPCVVILPCKDPVKITGYHSNPSSYVVGT